MTDPGGDFGWSIGTIGAGIATYYLVGALFAPVSGWLGDRYGARRMMLAGGILYGTSMVLLGFVSNLWQFFIVYGVIAGPYSKHFHGAADGIHQWLVQAALGLGHRYPVGRRAESERPS